MNNQLIKRESRYYDMQANASERMRRFNKMENKPIIIRLAARGAFSAAHLSHCTGADKAAAVKWSNDNPEFTFGIEAKSIIASAN